ncbi:hypothetical protein D3C81_1267490 [compost metagenome]
MPLAPARFTSSSSGFWMADSAAACARSSPRAVPVPIIARPISDMTVRTSAKSTLIRPGRTIRSAMPCTAPCSTSLAARKAWIMVALRPSTVISFSLGMVISESQCWLSSSMPFSATCMRRRPSNGNGLVTTATVRMPISLASCATTGAAPVPVPPPMPAVMNTMSAPCSASMMRSRSSSAAWRPTSGFAPAPRPLVTLVPSCSCSLAPQFLMACESVLAVMNSTPSTAELTMCATALPPPPPTPTTLITALGAIFSISSKCAMSVSSLYPLSIAWAFGRPAFVLHAVVAAVWVMCCRCCVVLPVLQPGEPG